MLHAPARLQLATVLANARDTPVAFADLQQVLGLTAGNLSTHLRRLEQEDYVEVTKAHRDRVPVTWVAMTDHGRTRLDEYRATMQRYLDGTALPDPITTEDG